VLHVYFVYCGKTKMQSTLKQRKKRAAESCNSVKTYILQTLKIKNTPVKNLNKN
jgi:hypothetical protein